MRVGIIFTPTASGGRAMAQLRTFSAAALPTSPGKRGGAMRIEPLGAILSTAGKPAAAVSCGFFELDFDFHAGCGNHVHQRLKRE